MSDSISPSLLYMLLYVHSGILLQFHFFIFFFFTVIPTILLIPKPLHFFPLCSFNSCCLYVYGRDIYIYISVAKVRASVPACSNKVKENFFFVSYPNVSREERGLLN